MLNKKDRATKVNVNRKCKRKQCLEENLTSGFNILTDHRIESLHMLFVHCQEGRCQYPSFAIITIDMLINIYLMVHVYASPFLQKYYINSRFIWFYPVTFNQATYAFNSKGKMWPVHIAFDMLCLEFKHLWCFNKLRMTVSTVGFGISKARTDP